MNGKDTKKLEGKPTCVEHDYTDWLIYRNGDKRLIKRCKKCPKVMHVKEFFEEKKTSVKMLKMPKQYKKVSHVELWSY